MSAPTPRRFYDGGRPATAHRPAEPPDPDRAARIALVRDLEAGREEFALERRIAFRDTRLGEILVPGDLETFRTDLASVPDLFRWLVPRTGRHLPAALIHDGLVGEPDYVSTDAHLIDREHADRVFRDAMAVSGTALIRRWLIWSAVSLATIASGSAQWSFVRRWHYRLAAVLSLVVTVVIGYWATWDLFDRSGPLTVPLPWMGDRSTPLELLGGLAAAIVVPFLLGLAWGRYRVAGIIVGLALAVLIHVTIVLLVLLGVYRAAEAAVRTFPVLSGRLAAVVVLAAAVLVVVLTGQVYLG